ncbi:hypothetical protein ALC57_15856 [Trachymyrmex cornetzi]|uniref:Helix-turn-helix domain-containing protein n=1 Tax=Trachymyrmex cornetzi TaxID=471704 RepID=A0A151IW08_9HYME|nr:hypothetical protein ALC57_15856 [Trachymyrmex cornetzi]
MFRLQHESVRLKSERFFRDTKVMQHNIGIILQTTFNIRMPKTNLQKMYTRWVVCDPEMNFGVILVKGYARIETGNAQNLSIFYCYMNHKRNYDIFHESCHDFIVVTEHYREPIYAYPKIHKTGSQFRIIISIDDEHALISLDVISLFINIPIELTINCLADKWEHIAKRTKISKNKFLTAIQLILDSTYFIFDNKIYRKKFGTPMGSPLSPIMADLVLVTLEIGGDKLNFLDITLIKNKCIIECDWFYKRFVNYHSLHPLAQKKDVIIGMVDRTVLLSHPKYHSKNIELIVNTFLDNNYPIEFIFRVIHSRVKYLIHKGISKQNNSDIEDETEKKSWFTVPYLPQISEKFQNIMKVLRYILEFLRDLSLCKLNYKIQCRDCDAIYVGQTRRLLKTRTKEHRNHINRKTSNESMITQHTQSHNMLEHSHDFEWEDIKILNIERKLSKRLISKILHVQLQSNSLNLQQLNQIQNFCPIRM